MVLHRIILALSDVQKTCRVTMDTGVEPLIQVHKVDGDVMVFHEHPSGLYVHDLNRANNYDKSFSPAYLYLQTVFQNKARYTRRQVELADGVPTLYHKLGRPSIHKFMNVLSKGLLLNCLYNTKDVSRAEDIYGVDMGFLQGKTKGPPGVYTYDAIEQYTGLST